MELVHLLIAVAAGAAVTWLVMRSRLAAASRGLNERRDEVRQERLRVEEARAEIRQLSEAKARAEQRADRVQGLEAELREAREASQRAGLKAAELAKEREADSEKLRWVKRRRNGSGKCSRRWPPVRSRTTPRAF